MSRLLFIRHGATAGNLQRRYIGRTDEPLCEQGIRQLAPLCGASLAVDRLYVSPLQRAGQTAALVFPQREYRVVPDFREMDFGDFEGKTAAELSGDPRYQAWVDTKCVGPVPGGESVAAFKRRCRAAFCGVMAETGERERIALVVHGGVIMSILEAFARPRRDFYAYALENGGCREYEYRAGDLTPVKRELG